MHIHTSIYTYIFHSMWTTQTSTRYVWEAGYGDISGEIYKAVKTRLYFHRQIIH